jgi:hypothetical protein
MGLPLIPRFLTKPIDDHQNTAALEARVASAEEFVGNVAIGVDTMWLLITVRASRRTSLI